MLTATVLFFVLQKRLLAARFHALESELAARFSRLPPHAQLAALERVSPRFAAFFPEPRVTAQAVLKHEWRQMQSTGAVDFHLLSELVGALCAT